MVPDVIAIAAQRRDERSKRRAGIRAHAYPRSGVADLAHRGRRHRPTPLAPWRSLVALQLLGCTVAIGPAFASPRGNPVPLPALLVAQPVRVSSTVHSIGVEWDVDVGDEGHTRVGRICYRRNGQSHWRSAPLLRIQYEGWEYRCCDASVDPSCASKTLSACAQPLTPDQIDSQTAKHSYRPFDMFAGSVMFLSPSTPYDVQLVVCDAGAACTCGTGTGAASPLLHVTTRARAVRHCPTRTFHVISDADRTSCTFDPVKSCTTCHDHPAAPGCARICNGLSGSGFPGFANAEQCARPGDLFLVHSGIYKGHVFTHCGDAGKYIAWVGAGDEAPARAPIGRRRCPTADDPGLGRLSAVTLRRPTADEASAAPGDAVASLVVGADHVWFEGLDLRPDQNGGVDLRGQIDGIVGDVRSPRARHPACTEPAADHHDAFGTTDVVVVRNALHDFRTAIGIGRWVSANGGEFKPYYWDSNHLSLGMSAGDDEDPIDRDGAVWGPPNQPGLRDAHRIDMHRQWQVADNVIVGGLGSYALVHVSFTADSDIAYNRLSMTQCKYDWNTLKTNPNWVPPSCTLDADTWGSQVHCDGAATVEYGCGAEQGGMISGPRCIRPKEEPDGVKLTGSMDIDVYGNDIRDIADDAIEGDDAYANVRVWRNRSINAANAFFSAQPMLAAPWYVVRNEVVGFAGQNGAGSQFLKFGVFDRLVVANNTFVNRSAQTGHDRADFLFKSLSRNNLLIQEYTNNCNAGGAMLVGHGDGMMGESPAFSLPGQSHADWKSDADYDGFDWDWLPDNDPATMVNGSLRDKCCQSLCQAGKCPADCGCGGCPYAASAGAGTVRWAGILIDKNDGPKDVNDFVLTRPATGQLSFQKWSRGCRGGARNGGYCEKDADCDGGVGVDYDRAHVADWEPAGGYSRCASIEPHARHVAKASIFERCAGVSDCRQRIDGYADSKLFSPDRLDLVPTCRSGIGRTECAVDTGDPAIGFLQTDIDINGAPFTYVNSRLNQFFPQPDLGAYEAGEPLPHYGPRPPKPPLCGLSGPCAAEWKQKGCDQPCPGGKRRILSLEHCSCGCA